jgi:hypothetical protein
MKSCFLIIVSVLLLSGNQIYGKTDSFDPDIRKLYLHFDTDAANRLLIQRYPASDPRHIRLLGYREFLNNILHQSKSNTDQYIRQSDVWLKSLEKSRDYPVTSLPARAEIHLYRAVLASQISEYKISATELIASYRIVAKSGLDFTVADRNKLSGILGVLFQQIPDQQNKYLKLLGIRPSGLSGFSGLDRYYGAAAMGSVERMEGYLLLLTALKEFSQDPEAAWNFARKEGTPMLDNPLIRYQCSLAALKAGDCDAAAGFLQAGKALGYDRYIPYWNYQLGRMNLYRNEPAASDFLEAFIARPGGDNYRHNAILLHGWWMLLQGQKEQWKGVPARMRALPAPLTTYDKQAMREIATDSFPNPELLKARLLFDGGYYSRCLDLSGRLLQRDGFSSREVGELYYRMARCEQRLGKNTSAIGFFLRVVEDAANIRSYLVPNSALQLGHLYKSSGQNELARKYYQLCLDQNKYGYRDGLNRQAEKGLRDLGR